MLEDAIYIELAEYLMFSENKNRVSIDKKLDDLGLQFRKNKGIKDINKAIETARDPKNGHYRTELEIDMLAIYLKVDVVKKKAKYKVGDKVKIVDFPPRNSAFMICDKPVESEMGKWLGKVMTIKKVEERCYIMKEDNGRWAWTPSLIEKKVD